MGLRAKRLLDLASYSQRCAASEQIRRNMNDFGIPPEAIGRAVVFAIEQPDDIEIGEMTIRPTVQG